MLALANRILSRLPGNGGKLSILIYHRVLKNRDYLRPDEPTVDEFDRQMTLIARYFTPLSLTDAVEKLQADSLPPNAVCITFDDGYADNYHLALPVLKKYRLPATVFVATGFLNGGRMWNDTVIEAVRYSTEDQWSDLPGLPVLSLRGEEARKQTADTIIKTIKHLEPGKRLAVVEKLATRVNHLPDNLMMSDQELLDLSHNGVEIGAHTVTHPILTKISPNEVMEEIEEGRSYLANLLGKEIRYFAYPNGRAGQDYDDSHVQLVKTLGFEAAVTTNAGVSTIGTDRFRLARFTPWDKTPFKFYLRMVKNRLSGYGQA